MCGRMCPLPQACAGCGTQPVPRQALGATLLKMCKAFSAIDILSIVGDCLTNMKVCMYLMYACV